ncbi:MAG: class I mannose-6-phosphate isomerase [Acidobacteriaceae bacterium]|nr:class I mannose-6-phosphate isomerase [Acidobacteriaceae bacterium]
MTRRSNYEKHPAVVISSTDSDCASGWREICDRLLTHSDCSRIAIECYPGVNIESLRKELLACLAPELVLESAALMLPPTAIEDKFANLLGDDRVFARMMPVELTEFFDPDKLDQARCMAGNAQGRVIALGTGATLVLPTYDLLIYVDVARWEIQQRQRRGEVSSLGLDNASATPAQLYKRAFFLDWRAADRKRHQLYPDVDFWIDGNLPAKPSMLSGSTFRAALTQVAQQPFRVVPFFDPGPWGGQWMRNVCDLPDGPPNYAWCFDCVPEENSLALRFGARTFELPSLTLVHEHPHELLGADIVSKFGAEFPIRFDFLDTMEGGNLSLQVHPLRSYIQEQFGMPYTQDESYYILDAAPDATVFLGLRDGIDPQSMATDLNVAQTGGPPFPAEKYVNAWPVRKHDHFLIPAGTIHCSGHNSMVLEISATPYIFTFKLWDWGRMGLDGRPRPIHLEHGLKNIQWDRTTSWVQENLINQEAPLAKGDGWREERTGLHPLEFIETRRHWFTGPVPHDTQGNLNVLNLVEGEAAVVESPTGAFSPLTVHYAETFIIPATVGAYTIRPAVVSTKPLATMKAYVRKGP